MRARNEKTALQRPLIAPMPGKVLPPASADDPKPRDPLQPIPPDGVVAWEDKVKGRD